MEVAVYDPDITVRSLMNRILLLAASALVILGCSTERADAAGKVDQDAALPAPQRQPIVLLIAGGDAREIKPAEYLDYSVSLPGRSCTISGKIEGITGGNKDFEAFIMDDENFRNWKAHLSSQGVQSGRKVVWSFSETVTGPGDWHVVVSNAFSSVTAKAITISAKAECPA